MKDQAFIDWFATDWQKLLESTSVPGMPDASWDRKAAWLYWSARRPPTSLLPAAPVPAGLLPR